MERCDHSDRGHHFDNSRVGGHLIAAIGWRGKEGPARVLTDFKVCCLGTALSEWNESFKLN